MRDLRKLRQELARGTRKFGDMVTAVHTSFYEGGGNYALHSQALSFIVKDMYSGYLASYPGSEQECVGGSGCVTARPRRHPPESHLLQQPQRDLQGGEGSWFWREA